MGTEIAHRVEYPAPTPQVSKSLSQQGLQDHRRAIAFEVKIVLSAYFKPNEDEEIRAGQLAWWCDELQDWTQEQVVWSLRQWNRANPDKRPTPGHIVGIMTEMRGQKEAAKIRAHIAALPPEPPRQVLSEEERTRQAVELGLPDMSKIFRANRSAGIDGGDA